MVVFLIDRRLYCAGGRSIGADGYTAEGVILVKRPVHRPVPFPLPTPLYPHPTPFGGTRAISEPKPGIYR
jgi:hypothetical protein